MLPYSRDGFVINGFKDQDGNLHMSNMRIYKQRSMSQFDLIDISTDKIYQKVFITTTVSDTQEILDYSNTDVNLALQISKNSFFIRNFNKEKEYYGFIIRVMKNKVTIDSFINVSHYIYNYELYIHDEPKIFSLTYAQPSVGATSFSFLVNGQFINPSTIVATIELEDGTIYTGTNVGFQVSFSNILLTGTKIKVKVEALGAIDYNEEIALKDIPVSTDIVTEVIVPSSKWVNNGGVYSYTILSSEHNRGAIFAIQTYDNTTNDLVFVQSSIDSSGAITLTKNDNSDLRVDIAGSSSDGLFDATVIDVSQAQWIPVVGGYQYSIPSSSVPTEFGVFNIWVDSGSRYELAFSDLVVDFSNNIVLNSTVPYNAKLVLV